MSSHRLPPLNALRAFEAVARLESMSRAADELAVTPGAVSQQVRQLEEHVGVKLFERQGRMLALNGAGRAAAGAMTDAFAALGHAVSLMRQPVERRSLTVSVAPSFAGKWLAPRLHRFQEQYPGVEVWIPLIVSAPTWRPGLRILPSAMGRAEIPAWRSACCCAKRFCPSARRNCSNRARRSIGLLIWFTILCCMMRRRRVRSTRPTGSAG